MCFTHNNCDKSNNRCSCYKRMPKVVCNPCCRCMSPSLPNNSLFTVSNVDPPTSFGTVISTEFADPPVSPTIYVDPVTEIQQILLEEDLILYDLIAANQANGINYVYAIAVQQRTNNFGIIAMEVRLIYDEEYFYLFDYAPLL